jgi:DNA segregation ATPase FtsK/SpoIIIE-like protein
MNEPKQFDCAFCAGNHDLTPQIQYLKEEGSITVSRIQRRFLYGYNHALTIFEKMQEQKLISLSGVSLLKK